MRFANFLSGGFTTMAVMNPPEKKLGKRTSVHWSIIQIPVPMGTNWKTLKNTGQRFTTHFFSIQGSGDDAGSKSPDANDFDDEDGNGITIDVAKEPGVKFSSLVEDEK